MENPYDASNKSKQRNLLYTVMQGGILTVGYTSDIHINNLKEMIVLNII